MLHPKKPTKTKFYGFTLVELIVVITILAILGTIGFLSVGGYSSRARDSARVGDTAQVTKSLDLAIVTSGSYPVPDNSFAVTYSGGVVWNQGTIGSNVMQYFKGTISGGGINKKPVDPLSNTEYVYSSLAEGKAYQIKADYEGNLAQNAMGEKSILDIASAAPGNPTIAYIRGNYGGVTAKTTTGGIVYILAVPSIITNSGTTLGAGISVTSLSGSLLFNGRTLRNASSYVPGSVVFTGSKLPSTSTEISAMMTALQLAYSGSDIRNHQGVATVMSATGTSFVSLGSTLVTAQLGGTAIGTTSSTTSGTTISQCSAGTYSATGNAPCTIVSTGFYADTAGATSQTQCPANSYCPTVSGSPIPCGGSLVSPAGSTSTGACVVAQANPTGLSLSHSSRAKTFTFSWTAGAGNGASCRLQYFRNESTWTDISATTYNCDGNLTNQSVTLPGDGWNSTWSSIAVRTIRTSDSAVLGTFAQNLTCSSTGGSGGSTPSVDENCNGSWDDVVNVVISCNTCTFTGYEYVLTYFTDSSCTIVWPYNGTSCYATNQFGNRGCGPQDGRYSTWSTTYGCSITQANCENCGGESANFYN